MRTVAIVFVASCAILFTGCGDDKKNIQGKWEITNIDAGSDEEAKKAAEFLLALAKKAEVVIGDGTVTVNIPDQKDKDEKEEVTFTLNTSKSPREFDLTAKKKTKVANEKGELTEKVEEETMKGIYKLDGDTLTVAIGAGPEAPRPSKIEAVSPKKGEKNSGVIVVTFKRKK